GKRFPKDEDKEKKEEEENKSEKNEWYPFPTIWQLNQRSGGQSTVLSWPVGNFETKEGAKMTTYRRPGTVISWKSEAVKIVKALESDNFVAWHVGQPDFDLDSGG
ncbi:hypothetical protein PFISCL1PPCAC_15849, partial [Pristionchus fissidentatus]